MAPRGHRVLTRCGATRRLATQTSRILPFGGRGLCLGRLAPDIVGRTRTRFGPCALPREGLGRSLPAGAGFVPALSTRGRPLPGLPFQVDRLKQRRQFARCQVAPGTDRQVREAERSDTHPPQPFDRNPGRVHHIAHQMVRPFMDHHSEDETLRRLTQNPKLLRNHAMSIDDDPIAYSLQDRVGGPGQRQNVVLLVKLIARVHDAVRDVAVVGQQQETFGVAIEAADRVDPLRDPDDIHHGAAIPLILGRRDVSARLVEDQVPRTLRPEEFSVNLDLGAVGIGLRAEFGDDSTIDRHPPGRDQRFRRPARSDAACGENAL